jgi:hypothetical protein
MSEAFPGNSYDELSAKVRRHLREHKINEQLLALLQDASEQALAAQNVVLSRVERERLLTDVMESVWTDVLGQIAPGKHA